MEIERILRLSEPNECTRGMARVPTVLGIKDLQNGAEDRNYRPLARVPTYDIKAAVWNNNT